MKPKKSIFINEEEFNLDEEEIIEIDESLLEDFELPVEFPHDRKPFTDGIIAKATGVSPRELHKTLPDVRDLYGLLETTKAIERPKSLTHIKNCPRCATPLNKAIAINGSESESFLECSSCGTLVNTFKPIKYQAEVAKRNERYIMLAGGFGCTHPDMYILMYDGSKKKAKHIKLGELLMGPDNTPRKVLEIHKGNDTRYRVDLKGVVSSPLEFNGGHLLYLYNRDWTGIKKRGQHNYFGQYLTMPIEHYVHASKRFKNSHYWMFTQGFEYPYKEMPIEPYLLGLLLGDGYIGRGVSLTTNDKEIIKVCKLYEGIYNVDVNIQSKKGNTVTLSFVTRNKNKGTQGGPTNNLLNHLRGLKLSGTTSKTKFIPDIYKFNTKDVRRKVLAGIIDTDGYQHENTIDITIAGEKLANDIKDVAQSLGIRVNLRTRTIKSYPNNIYYRLTLSGEELNNIPVVLDRKKVNTSPNKRQWTQRFNITKVSDNAPYVGFTVDKDHLYVEAENYSIIHNSGKSRINIEKIISHLTLIPGARVVVAAKTYPAIEATFVKDFFSIMPNRLLRRKNEQKKEWIFTNGSELMLRSFDDPTKLRGINASMFVLLEASNIPHAGFELAQNRIRNTAALLPLYDLHGNPVYKYDEKAKTMRPVYRKDARKILIETNPDAGWVKKDFLLESHEVFYYGSAHKEGYNMSKSPDKNKFTLVMATDANPYLPENFIEEQTRGKSRAYILQFFYGSFNFSEGLVYPHAGACIVQPHPLPPEFDEQGKRTLWYLIGLDYGVSDALAIIYGAYSSTTHKIYFFDELYKHGLDVKTAVKLHRDKLKQYNITNDKLMFLPLFDGRSYNKREATLQTVGDLFNAEGLYFTPSFTNVDARITKFNGIMKEGDIEIYSNLEFFIEEITNYKFKPSRDGSLTSKPYDKDNHAINAGEFIIMALPLNIKNFDMSSYVPQGSRHIHDKEQQAQDSVKNIFNPYQGGKTNDRRITNYINNRYGSSDRTASSGTNHSVEAPDDNIFKAFVPRRTK